MTQGKYNSIGVVLRKFRESKQLLLREVSAKLNIDPSFLSKIEHGSKKPSREQILKLARIFDVEERELMIPYLSDRLLLDIMGEEFAMEAILEAARKLDGASKNLRLFDGL